MGSPMTTGGHACDTAQIGGLTRPHSSIPTSCRRPPCHRRGRLGVIVRTNLRSATRGPKRRALPRHALRRPAGSRRSRACAMRDTEACRSGVTGCSIRSNAARSRSLATGLLAAGLDESEQRPKRGAAKLLTAPFHGCGRLRPYIAHARSGRSSGASEIRPRSRNRLEAGAGVNVTGRDLAYHRSCL